MIQTDKPEEFNVSDVFVKFVLFFAGICVLFAIIVCGLLYSLKSLEHSEPNKLVDTLSLSVVYNVPYELTKESVYQQILDYGILEPEIVLRQSILETGWYTSKNCLERHGLFGMKGGDKTNDNPNGYAIYSHWRESVFAYKLWQDRNYNPEYCGTYYDFLEHIGYATSPEYVEKLKGIKL